MLNCWITVLMHICSYNYCIKLRYCGFQHGKYWIQWWKLLTRRLFVFTEPSSCHSYKLDREVFLHMCWKFPQNSHRPKAAVWYHGNRVRKYSVHFYSIKLWESHQGMTWLPGQLNPCDKSCHTGYMWCKGLLNSPDFSHIQILCLCMCSADLYVEKCQWVGFLNSIVPFHCVGVFKSSVLIVWSSLHMKYDLTLSVKGV